MATLEGLISDLVAATDQMGQAARADDWPLVERIQKRRRVLIRQLVTQVETGALDQGMVQRLRSLREQELRIHQEARTRQNALREVLARTQTPTQPDRLSRMQRTYAAIESLRIDPPPSQEVEE